MTVKRIITGGCSFSTYGETKTWVSTLVDTYTNLSFRHTAQKEFGQELIQRSISQAIDFELQTYKPEELAVIVMWSETGRKAFYVDSSLYIDELVDTWRQSKNIEYYNQLMPLRLSEKDNLSTLLLSDGNVINYTKSGYYCINCNNPDSSFAKDYVDTMNSNVAQTTISIENIIFLQNYCKIKGIKLLQCFYKSQVYDDILYNKDHENIGYLYNQLDHSTIVSTSGMLDHNNSCENWTKEILFPKLISQGIVK